VNGGRGNTLDDSSHDGTLSREHLPAFYD
jgi:hypothetical protein